MASRGVHFAITADQLSRLLAAANYDALIEIIEEIEESWDEEYLAESDKAWDAIHRCLTDGSLLYDNGDYPLNHVICGGQQLCDEDEYTVTLISSEQVKDVATAIGQLSESWFRKRYFSLLKSDEYDGEIGEDDFGYTWEWFQSVRDLFLKAAESGRAVIFTVDA